jgi:hypothetical protein
VVCYAAPASAAAVKSPHKHTVHRGRYGSKRLRPTAVIREFALPQRVKGSRDTRHTPGTACHQRQHNASCRARYVDNQYAYSCLMRPPYM